MVRKVYCLEKPLSRGGRVNAQPTLAPLIALSHHRWSLPLIAQLHGLSGAKFVTLSNRLQISRDSLSRTLAALREGGWVQHNAGYGHPLRPEYVLTPKGSLIGPACADTMKAAQVLHVEEAVLRKWALPVLWALGLGPARFGRLKSCLAGITARALAQTLKQLEDAGLVEWTAPTAGDLKPPYALTRRARTLGRALEALCAKL